MDLWYHEDCIRYENLCLLAHPIRLMNIEKFSKALLLYSSRKWQHYTIPQNFLSNFSSFSVNRGNRNSWSDYRLNIPLSLNVVTVQRSVLSRPYPCLTSVSVNHFCSFHTLLPVSSDFDMIGSFFPCFFSYCRKYREYKIYLQKFLSVCSCV